MVQQTQERWFNEVLTKEKVFSISGFRFSYCAPNINQSKKDRQDSFISDSHAALLILLHTSCNPSNPKHPHQFKLIFVIVHSGYNKPWRVGVKFFKALKVIHTISIGNSQNKCKMGYLVCSYEYFSYLF